MRVDYLTSAIQKSYCSSFEEFWPLWHKPQFNKPWNIKATSRFRKPSEAYTINFTRVLSIVEKCLEHHEGSRKLYFFIVRAAGLHVDVISFLIKKKTFIGWEVFKSASVYFEAESRRNSNSWSAYIDIFSFGIYTQLSMTSQQGRRSSLGDIGEGFYFFAKHNSLPYYLCLLSTLI